MRIFKTIVLTILLALVWAGLMVTAHLYGWFRTPLAEPANTPAFMSALQQEVAARSAGNISLVLLEAGEVVQEVHVSKQGAINGDTRFQVASMSKWLTAWGVMALVESGDMDLDESVNHYLQRWQLPDGAVDASTVTVRHLLSHTGGLTDGLGFAGYDPDTALPGLVEALNNPNASSGEAVMIAANLPPGSQFGYSGGGYLILQLLVEDVSGESFEDFMRQRVFDPLGMTRTTFQQLRYGEESNLALSFDNEGETATLYRFTASGAAGAFTTAHDMVRFIQAQAELISTGRPQVLSLDTFNEMIAPHAQSGGADIWGLGVMLYAPNHEGGFVIGHDGNNDPAINTAARFDPVTGDGIVILASGGGLIASELAGEWVFWHTGNVDFIDFSRTLGQLINWILAGWLVLSIACLFILFRNRGQKQA